MRGTPPVLIYGACQLAGLLINTSRARRRDETFVANGVEHVGVALTQLSSGGGELQSYAPFVPHECGEAGVYILISSDENVDSSAMYYYDKRFVLILQ